MATLGATYLNIADKIKRLEPDGEKIAKIIELLSETNEILQDMIVLEGNTQTGHRTTMRSGLPSTTWRKLYGYTQPSKSTTVQVDETCGILEAFSVLDKDFADLGGNAAELRVSEDQAFLQAMNNEFAATLFYGNTDTDPEEFLGLSPRFSSLSADNGGQIIDGGGSGSDNTSMWLIKWGENYTHGIYPRGTMAGLQHEDMGVVTETDGSGGKRVVYQTRHLWKVGLAVRDYRHIVRIANLDVSNLATAASGSDSSADLINLMIEALHQDMENLTGGKLAFYCDRVVYTALTKKAVAKANVQLDFVDFGGPNRVMTFQGIPIKRVDGLLATEAQVT